MVHNATGCLVGIGKNYFIFVKTEKHKPIKYLHFIQVNWILTEDDT